MTDKSTIKFLNHDVNNCLGVALGFIELAQTQSPEIATNPMITKALNALVRGTDLSHELGKQCRTADESEAQKEDFPVMCVNEHLENNLVPEFESIKQRFNIDIELVVTPSLEKRYARINPKLVMRWRENLISNAADAGATKVEVSYTMLDYCLCVTYKDNGRGMTQEQVDKIQLKLTNDEPVHGLGSQSILNIAHQHGAPITYESTQGQGTIVRTILPYVRV